MRVTVYPADNGGCGHYRMIWPARALIEQGFDIDLVLPDSGDDRLNVNIMDGRVFNLVDPPDSDVVVLQRPLRRHLVDTIPLLQKQGKIVVVEVDDDFRHISSRNAAWASCQPSHSERNWKHLERACDMADWVTVSTPALVQRYGYHGRVSVLPNYVPERYLSIEVEPQQDTYLGWSGSVANHPDDLQVVGPGVARALQATNAKFAVVGTGVGVHRKLHLPPRLSIQISDWLPIDRYPEAMAQLNVGIVPLELSPFNQAKSWLKGLEFAALGVPFVASPTQQYEALFHQYRIGELANHPRAWERKLVEHLGDPYTTAKWGQSYKRRVDMHDLVIERRATEWMMVWANAWKGRNARLA